MEALQLRYRQFAVIAGISCLSCVAMSAAPQVASAQDCNSNGIDDATDISGGTSTDCNANSIPDECEMIPPGLVSWWPGEGNFSDVQGANDGTNAGGTSFVTGHVGQAFSFDGTGNSYITIPNSPDLLPASNELTISAWIKPDFGAGNGIDTIMTMRAGCNGFGISYNLNVSKPSGTFSLTLDDQGFVPAVSTSPIPNDGQFHHVAGTYDGSLLEIYLDGAKVGEAPLTAPLLSTGANVVISHHGGSCPQRSAAVIDEIQFYDRALGATEIATLFVGVFADCNSNGSLDVCDITAGTSADCNSNGIPDDCELVGNDCNANSIPDECELGENDCNTNEEGCERGVMGLGFRIILTCRNRAAPSVSLWTTKVLSPRCPPLPFPMTGNSIMWPGLTTDRCWRSIWMGQKWEKLHSPPLCYRPVPMS